MDMIKKFELFGEFGGKTIYGSDFADALMHCPVNRPRFIRSGVIVPSEQVHITCVLGYDNTTDASRGGKCFIRAIVETTTGGRISIDAVETGFIEVLK